MGVREEEFEEGEGAVEGVDVATWAEEEGAEEWGRGGKMGRLERGWVAL